VEQRGGLFVPVAVGRRTEHPGAGPVYCRDEQSRLPGLGRPCFEGDLDDVDQDTAYELVVDVASGEESDVAVIARRLRAL
jgi:hypothetical protein